MFFFSFFFLQFPHSLFSVCYCWLAGLVHIQSGPSVCVFCALLFKLEHAKEVQVLSFFLLLKGLDSNNALCTLFPKLEQNSELCWKNTNSISHLPGLMPTLSLLILSTVKTLSVLTHWPAVQCIWTLILTHTLQFTHVSLLPADSCVYLW